MILREYPAKAGQKPKTSDRLEEMLLLETLAATPLDSVTYYAFAEDNYPGTPRRTETDLRYIDLRSFKREYKVEEPLSGDGEPEELTTLIELIARQRVNLNRATRLAKRRATDRTEAEDPLKIASFEESLMTLTREFTEGVEALADARVDSLHKALDAMQAALDALDRSKNEEAPPAMAEALKQLVAARRDILFLIGDTSPAMAAAMRKFDRTQAQKIRKPKSKDQEAEEIADRLEALADEEEFVYATISKPDQGEPDPKAKPMPAQAKDAEATPKQAEPKDAPKEPKDAPAKGQQPAPAKGDDGPKGQEAPKGPPGSTPGPGEGTDGEGGAGESRQADRRSMSDKQREIADAVRDLEEKLKAIEAASDLAKVRLGKAAEKVEQAAGAMARGNTREAAEAAKDGAAMLHEVARQVKGEIAREAADQLAMARDLADELARREGELAERKAAAAGKPDDQPGQGGPKGKKDPAGQGGDDPTQKDGQGQTKKDEHGQGGPGDEPKKDGQGGPGDEPKKDGQGQAGQGDEAKKDGQGQTGQGAGPKEDGQGQGQGGKGDQPKPGQGGDAGKGGKNGQGAGDDGEKGKGAGGKGGGQALGRAGRGAPAGWAGLTEAEQVERMAEMARTLEQWLAQIEKRGEGKAAEAIRDVLEGGTVAQVVEAADRMGELRVLGKDAALGKVAREQAARLEALAQTLGLLHQGIVAPELAAMVEFDRRVADLTARMADLKTEAAVAAWRRDAAALVRDLEKAGVDGATDLADALRIGGGWHWDNGHHHLVPTDPVIKAVGAVSVTIKDRVQDLILKDLASARDEATPPEYRELVERYYEVISRGVKAK